MTNLLTELQTASLPLASELMPQAVAQMRAEIRRLESLPVMNPEWRKAVLRFVEDYREEICTGYPNTNSSAAITLHTVAETETPSLFTHIVDRMLCGDLSGLWMFCTLCCRVACGGPELCREAAQDVLSPEERFAQQLPEFLHAALAKMLAGRELENE